MRAACGGKRMLRAAHDTIWIPVQHLAHISGACRQFVQLTNDDVEFITLEAGPKSGGDIVDDGHAHRGIAVANRADHVGQ